MRLGNLIKDPVNWGLAAAIAVVATVVWIPFAQAELVYENEAIPTRVQPQIAETAPLQQVPVQQMPLQQVPVQQMPVQQQMILQPRVQSYAPSPQVGMSTDIQNLSKTELMRRERVREELKNEDVLQERLEDLRLKDEKRRTDQVLGLMPVNAGQPTAQVYTPPLTEQMVGAPVTERRADAVATAVVLPAAPPAHSDQIALGASTTSTTDWGNEKTYISIQPRFGIVNMNNTGYDIRPRYAAGVGLGLIVSDNIGFEAGYNYSENGIAIAPSHPWVQSIAAQGFTGANYETHALKKNVFDAGIKLHVLGMDSRIRPYVGGGGGYEKSFLNYDQNILSILSRTNLPGIGNDYQVDSFLGYLTTGLDLRASRSIMVGASFKYYTVLSARETGQMNNSAFYGYNYNTAWMDPAKQYLGGSLARVPYYSIAGSVSFIF